MRRALIILFLFLLLLPACTIRRRVHTRGFYIEWHKRYKKVHAEKETVKLPDAVEDTLAEAEPDSVSIPETLVIRDTLVQDSVAERPDWKEKTPKEDRKFEPLGVFSAKLLLAPLLVAVLDDKAEDKRMDFWLSVVFLVLLALCLVLGTISMVRYLRNPRAYKFNIWAILAILIPVTFAILVIMDVAVLF